MVSFCHLTVRRCTSVTYSYRSPLVTNKTIIKGILNYVCGVCGFNEYIHGFHTYLLFNTTLSWTHSPFPLAVVINCMISAASPADTVEDNLQMWKGNSLQNDSAPVLFII